MVSVEGMQSSHTYRWAFHWWHCRVSMRRNILRYVSEFGAFTSKLCHGKALVWKGNEWRWVAHLVKGQYKTMSEMRSSYPKEPGLHAYHMPEVQGRLLLVMPQADWCARFQVFRLRREVQDRRKIAQYGRFSRSGEAWGWALHVLLGKI